MDENLGKVFNLNSVINTNLNKCESSNNVYTLRPVKDFEDLGDVRMVAICITNIRDNLDSALTKLGFRSYYYNFGFL